MLSFNAESTLTDRYQTTVPEPVRRALQLGKRDKLQYTVKSDGEVVLRRVEADEEGSDEVMGAFLSFLANDIKSNPARVQPVDPQLVARAHALVGHIDVDLDGPLSDD